MQRASKAHSHWRSVAGPRWLTCLVRHLSDRNPDQTTSDNSKGNLRSWRGWEIFLPPLVVGAPDCRGTELGQRVCGLVLRQQETGRGERPLGSGSPEWLGRSALALRGRLCPQASLSSHPSLLLIVIVVTDWVVCQDFRMLGPGWGLCRALCREEPGVARAPLPHPVPLHKAGLASWQLSAALGQASFLPCSCPAGFDRLGDFALS